ncbi:hypothetical protein R1sor_011733 [Riccia sorocarpa]|uniref:Sulfite exporter TauE/SafE family protein n=1 Tax=Riccia sorocarpa TaxID=122646 RepID=A0ABD3I4F4_9MARC
MASEMRKSNGRKLALAECYLGMLLTFILCTRADAISSSNYRTPHRFTRVRTDGKMIEQQNWSNCSDQGSTLGIEGGDYNWPKLEFNTRSVAAIVLGGVGASLCTAAGLGGGGLFVPLFNLLLQFDSKTSAALSNFMIVGGQLITMLLNLPRSDPVSPGKPLIDFEAALLLQPNLLLGITIGVILNVIFPGWLVTLLLTVVLAYMTVNSFQSGVKRWNKESQQLASSALDNGNLTKPLLEHPISVGYPVKKIVALAMVWMVFFVVQIVRNEGEKCGVLFWVLTASQVPFGLIVTYFAVKNQLKSLPNIIEGSQLVVIHEHQIGSLQGNGFVLGPRESSLFPNVALVTGILGGMLGIGGAMIINPLLMQAGMHPQVTAATSGFMVVFSSSMSVVQYWLLGRVPVDWALTAAGLSALFSAVGILLVQRIVQKYGRASLIVFIVAFVIGLSALLMGSLGGLNVWEQYRSGAYMGFHSPC